MSDGNKRMKINTLERAVSTDIDRMQAFAATDRAEILRRLLNCRLDVNVPGLFGGGYQELGNYMDTNVQDGAVVSTPLRGDVIEGLVVLPQPGTLNLQVSPGVVFLDDPDGQTGSSQAGAPNADDSRYKLVVFPGLATNGVLLAAVGGGGSDRVDVIEVQRNQVVTEQANRDIYDPGTGLFTPALVDKVDKATFTAPVSLRRRAGTAGAGLPANVQGWLPICVIVVPTGATTVNDMTFWDVRPLVKDRHSGIGGSQMGNAVLQDSNQIFGDDVTDAAKTLLYGFSTSQIGMYRAGGLVAGVATGFDAKAAANQVPGYTPLSGFPWYLYAIFPGGLPRWVKYMAYPATRVPLGPLGVLAISGIGPATAGGDAISNSVLSPLSTGLLATGPAVVLAVGMCSAAPAVAAIVMRDGMCRLGAPKQKAAAASTATTDDFNYSPGTDDLPKNAKGLLIEFIATFSVACWLNPVIDIRKPGAATVIHSMQCSTMLAAAAVGTGLVIEVPKLPFEVAAAGYASENLEVTIQWNQSTGTKSAPTSYILGIRI
jgi:hypothetical protein